MERTIKVELNKFKTIPNQLDHLVHGNVAGLLLSVDLAGLYHHYYLDAYGKRPPNPDPAQFEYAAFLSNCTEFRLAGDGIGDSVVARRHASTSLGQAFCRWFMHKYLDITYFVHMQHVLNKARRAELGGLRFTRCQHGDAPDYVCAGRSNEVVLAEAKGRYSSISFRNLEFASWRMQFDRVAVKDKQGVDRILKGYIVGTRFATEESGGRISSTLYAEDPASPGESPLDEAQINSLRSAIIAGHYGNIATKLNQPLLAAALEAENQLPQELRILATVWEFQVGPLKGQRFVGGYYPSNSIYPAFSISDNKLVQGGRHPFRLDVGQGTFFGVVENIFRSVVAMVRPTLRNGAVEMPTYHDIVPFYSAVSVLRDGSLVAPLEFLQPVEELSL